MFGVLFFLKGFIWLIDVASMYSLKKFVQGGEESRWRRNRTG